MNMSADRQGPSVPISRQQKEPPIESAQRIVTETWGPEGQVPDDQYDPARGHVRTWHVVDAGAVPA